MISIKEAIGENRPLNLISKDLDEGLEIIKEKELFSVSNLFYIEALKFNVGLNRKFFIDYDGSIKNYPTHDKVFGNIFEEDLLGVLRSIDFQRKWHFNKDRVEVCRDCQYRYMCNDPDDITENDGKLIKKNNCNYDPYTASWS